MCRIGELLKARWEHVDLSAGEWFVPRKNTKTKVAWKVYLSPFALRQFKALHALTGETPFCFPSNATPAKRQHSMYASRACRSRLATGRRASRSGSRSSTASTTIHWCWQMGKMANGRRVTSAEPGRQ